MKKKILVTGTTDGIGLETVKMLANKGHHLLLHGRNMEKLHELEKKLQGMQAGGPLQSYVADLSKMVEVRKLAKEVMADHNSLDVLINNAGVYSAGEIKTADGLDLRFAVNTIAPYLLTRLLLGLMNSSGRVINLSSAAQFPVNLEALWGKCELSDGGAYAQSKLALTMWSRELAEELGQDGPAFIAVNPRSMLGTKMVRQAYGVAGSDLRIGADILCRAALSQEFTGTSGQYFDNDIGSFSAPHPDALDPGKCAELIKAMDEIVND